MLPPMEFRLEHHIKPWKKGIGLQDNILLLGSCFTEHMAAQLRQHRFSVMENPHGILFNPISIAEALEAYASQKKYTEADLIVHEGLWYSWQHHGRFAAATADKSLQLIQQEVDAAAAFLPQAHWLIVTLGSAFVYRLQPHTPYNAGAHMPVAANCHRVPAQYFSHSLLPYPAAVDAVQQIVLTARRVQPLVKVIFTISPVRHYREGLVENNRSKGLLHLAVKEAIQQHPDVFYFPAYELIIDDLRDYRFFAEDMVHPNYQATRYVWEKFAATCLQPTAQQWLPALAEIHTAMQHRPRQPHSAQHKKFCTALLQKISTLEQALPYLSLQDAKAYFEAALQAVDA